jgi:ABC-type multidrug transport system fused ATPase/permease subunit/GGDEF domain-containing protein
MQQSNFSSDFKVFFKYLKKVRPWLGVMTLAFFMEISLLSFDVVLPLFSRVLFDYAYPLRSLTLLNLVIGGMVVLYFVRFWIDSLTDYQSVYVNEEFSMELQSELFQKLQRVPISYIHQKSGGDWVTRLTDDVGQAESLILGLPQRIILNVIHFVAVVFLAFSMNPTVTWLALASIPLYLLETKFFSDRLSKVQEDSLVLSGSVLNYLQEKIQQIFLVKAFRQEEGESQRYRKYIKRGFVLGIKGKLLQTIAAFTDSITIQLWTVGITWYLGYQVIQGSLTVGEVVALGLLLGQLGSPIAALGSVISQWKMGMVSLRRIDEILSAPLESQDQDLVRPPLSIKDGQVDFREVTFEYNPGEPVLRNISITFNPKSAVAIVGPSGSGKSTLVNLLLHYYSPSQGGIYIDGQSISSVSTLSLRETVGIVAQDYGVFEGTIWENITYGKPEATKEEVIAAARDAAVLDFVEDLPDQWETVIGGTDNLSGGQKQRIALARALVLDPAIIIFDEATSALDPVSEFRIQQVIRSLSKKKTVLIIAHRLSTIRNVDTIAVFDHGRIVESGSFEDLMKKKGTFFRLHAKQFGGFAELKKSFDIEHERTLRYGSTYSLAVFSFDGYHSIKEKHGEGYASVLMSEIELKVNIATRLGDIVAAYEDGLLIGLFPEVSKEKIGLLAQRLEGVLKGLSVEVDEQRFDVNLRATLMSFSDIKKLPQSSEEMLTALMGASGESEKGFSVVELESLQVSAKQAELEDV